MIGEINFFGVFFSPLIPWALAALPLTFVLRRLLLTIGFYRLVWHPALFNLALFVLMWAVVAAYSPQAMGLLQPVP